MSRSREPGFAALVRRIGKKEAARRMGIRVRTVRDWLRLGVPEHRVADARGVAARSERAVRAAEVSRAYREFGWTRLKNWGEVDDYIGAPPGHAMERWKHRKKWWDEHRPGERLPKKIAIVRDQNGRLMYVNGDAVVWRAYTVDGRLFWTIAQYLEGYDTPQQMKEIYDSLAGRQVVLTW